MSVIGIEGNQGTNRRVLVMPIEGVLKKEVGGQLNPDGFHLYRTLQSMYRIILISIDSNTRRVTEWLDKEGVFGYDDILYPMTLAGNWITESYWANIIRILRMRGYSLALVLVNGPEEARDVLDASVPVLMFSQPAYGLPEWLPGSRRGAEAWDELVGKIETERAARLNDKRMDEPVE